MHFSTWLFSTKKNNNMNMKKVNLERNGLLAVYCSSEELIYTNFLFYFIIIQQIQFIFLTVRPEY